MNHDAPRSGGRFITGKDGKSEKVAAHLDAEKKKPNPAHSDYAKPNLVDEAAAKAPAAPAAEVKK